MPGPQFPFGKGGSSMKLNTAGRGGSLRLHATATATAASAASAASSRGHFLQKSAPQSQRTSLGSRPLTAGTFRQQDHWLSDFWPQRSLVHGVTTSAAAAAQSVQTREPAEAKPSRSQRSSLDVQRDVPLPDEPTTPAQRQEGPFLDAASSSSDSADAAAADSPTAASLAIQEAVQDAATSSSSSAVTSSTVVTSDVQQQQQQQQQPQSPTSDAASSAAADSPCSHFSSRSPTNVVVSMLMPRAMSGWLLGPGGAKAKANQIPGAKWWLTDRTWQMGGQQNLRLLLIQGSPEKVGDVLKVLFGLIFAEGAPSNNAYFKTRAGQYKVKVVLQTWLVGSLLGKEGHTIRSIQESSGSRMQVVPLERAINPTGKKEQARIEGPEAVLEVAADSVDALAAGAQAAYQAIAVNPKYKPFVRKSPEDYPAALRWKVAHAAV
jgi:hypothetical protein